MRRGLIRWDAEELPLEVLLRRMQRLRLAMAGAEFDAIILYTNFIRCAAVSWLTGFSPYWADGILVVTAEHEPFFATSLSRRMGSWIQTVMPNASVLTSPNAGRVAGERLAQSGARRIGVLELNDFPAGLYADLSAALPEAKLADASDVFASARFPVDEAEKLLLGRADEIARQALDAVDSQGARNAGEAAGTIEKSARMNGAEEIYVAVAHDLDHSHWFLRRNGDYPLGRRYALRASVAYKGSWVRRIRSFSRDAGDVVELRRADDWFCELLATAGNWSGNAVARSVSQLPGAVMRDWAVERALGTRPLSVVTLAETGNSLAAPLVPTVHLTVGGGIPWCGAGLALPK